MNYYSPNFLPPRFIVNRANQQASIRQDKRRTFSKRGLAVISYVISAAISGAIWLGVFRTAEHFLK
jgi:hypothetical protein